MLSEGGAAQEFHSNVQYLNVDKNTSIHIDMNQ